MTIQTMTAIALVTFIGAALTIESVYSWRTKNRFLVFASLIGVAGSIVWVLYLCVINTDARL